MGASACTCPLCRGNASASDIDYGNKVRIYCEHCTAYDLTRLGFRELTSSSNNRREALVDDARGAPLGKILVITKDFTSGITYEVKESKPDMPAPDWLVA